MPPKKAGKKDGPAKLADKENLARAEAEILSLQRLLELRTHEAVEARRSERLWRDRLDAFSQALDKQKEDTVDITSDMLRQYKAMQEQMLKRINELEDENLGLKKGLDEKQAEIDKLKGEATTLKRSCDTEVAEYQRRMEAMQLEFTQMLRETLDKMHAKLADLLLAAEMATEQEILTELGIKQAPKRMLDVHKNPLLISILDGVDTLKNMAAKQMVPAVYLQNAKGLLFMKTDKIGFGLSITQGYGLVIARAANRPSGWSAPLPVKVDGFSVGAVMGFSEQHTIICLATDEEITNFKQDKRAMKLGLEMALNLKDMLNTDMALDTTAVQTGQSGLKTKAFTISKGVMMDMSLKGTSVETDVEDIGNCYGGQVTPAEILNGGISPPREATLLYNTIREILDEYKQLSVHS